MSFAQTTSAAGIPTRLQNSGQRIIDMTPGAAITSTTFGLSKQITLDAAYGNYLVCGAVTVSDTVPTGQWLGLTISQTDSGQVYSIAIATPPSAPIFPVSFMMVVRDEPIAITFEVASQSGSVTVGKVDLQLILI